MKNKKMFLGIIALIVMLAMSTIALGIGCTYTSTADGSDFFNVNTANVNTTTTLTDDQLFEGLTAFTPRLNFTKEVNETFTGVTDGSYNVLSWRFSKLSDNSTIVLYNGSNVVAAGNYTFAWQNTTTGTWIITWHGNDYNGSTIRATFTRTFVKNVDDLVVSPNLLNKDASTAYFLTQNTPTAYGDEKTFKFNSLLLGNYVNNTNWAVTWTYTQRVCTGGQNPSAIAGIGGLKVTLFAAFGLLAVLLLAMIAWGIIQVLKSGGTDVLMPLVLLGISGAIILFVAVIIIALVANAMGA